jgi:FkbM family methyltransferase
LIKNLDKLEGRRPDNKFIYRNNILFLALRFFQGIFFSLKTSASRKSIVSYKTSRSGFEIWEKGLVSLPPIRYTPIDLEELAIDYYFFSYTPKKGDVIIDVGAGLGTELATYCKLVQETGVVHAFECHPLSIEICKRMISANRLEGKVVLHEFALGNKESSGFISNDPNSLGINSIISEQLLQGPKIPILIKRLDSVFNALNSHNEEKKIDREGGNFAVIDFMKINVEGAEYDVLLGAEQTLKRTRNLVVSCHDFLSTHDADPMRTGIRVRDLLSRLGFTLSFRSDNRPVIRDMIYATRIF